MDNYTIKISRPFLLGVQGKDLHLLDVYFPVVLVESQGLLLGWALDVGLVLQQLLDPQQNLLHCDVRLPVFLFIQNGEADSSRRVNIRMR